MNLNEKVKDLYKVRTRIGEAEEVVKSIEIKLKARKEELSKDEVFASLNEEYMAAQKIHHDLISEFVSKNDGLISDYGAVNE